MRLRNPNIQEMPQDILYHLALGSGSHDLQEMFGDVKFVCMGGTPKRMQSFAYYIMDEIGYKLPAGTTLLDISLESYRYSMFKVFFSSYRFWLRNKKIHFFLLGRSSFEYKSWDGHSFSWNSSA